MSEDPAVKKHHDILKLISLYKNYTCLWNPDDPGPNINDRKDFFDKIAAQLGCSSNDVKSKLRNLRAQFRREVVRQKRLNTNRPKWIYYHALSFLRPSIQSALETNELRASVYKPQPIVTNVDEEWPAQLSPTNDYTDMTNFYESNGPCKDDLHDEYESDSEPLEASANGGYVKHKTSDKPFISCQSSKDRDEFTNFGQLVANELRSLDKRKDLQASLKCSILQAILDVNTSSDYIQNSQNYNEQDCLHEYVP